MDLLKQFLSFGAAIVLVVFAVVLFRAAVDVMRRPDLIARGRQEGYGLKAWLKGKHPWFLEW